MKERVKYYSSIDMLFGFNLAKVENMQIPAYEAININDAIEFYEISRYLDQGVRLKTWSDEAFQEYQARSAILVGLTKRFFKQIDDGNIIELYRQIDIEYLSVFWMLFDNCNLYNRISSSTFEALINGERISPHDMFLYKNIVRKYGMVLRNYILENAHFITIILHVYEQDHTPGDKLHLPDELSGEDIGHYIESYVDGDRPNANHLRTIVEMRCSKRFPITDEIRLKAKRRLEKELEELSKTGVNISHGIRLSFNLEQTDVVLTTNEAEEHAISYSVQWLLDTLDYPSILNNFICVFEFVDVPQMRSLHVNKTSHSGVMERALSSKSSRVYPANFYFKYMNGIASMQMHAYYDFLSKQGIRLEEVLEWFFTEQLQAEYGCPEIRLSMPSSNSSYAEKCSSIISAFESVLKQYSLYVKNGEIDFDLVRMSTTPVLFSNVKSMIADKYLYGTGADYDQLSFVLFSDQCIYHFVDRIYKEGRSYKCVFDLLRHEDVYLSDYREIEYVAFEDLAKFDLVKIGDDGKITLKDVAKLIVLRDLYENDVVSQWNYAPAMKDAISFFVEKGMVRASSTLFSQPEIDYLNYMLNRSEYSNGLEIRNRYVHGIQQVSNDEDEHMYNYLTLLRLFVLLAIKVNDEFYLRDMLNISREKQV